MNGWGGILAQARDAERRVASIERSTSNLPLRIPQLGVSSAGIPWLFQFIHLGYLWECRQSPARAGAPWQWRTLKYDGAPVTFTVDNGWFPIGLAGRDLANGNVTFVSPLDLAVSNPYAWRDVAIYGHDGAQSGSTFSPSMVFTDWPPMPSPLDGFGYGYVYNGKSWIRPYSASLGGSFSYPAKVFSSGGSVIHSFLNSLSWDRAWWQDHLNGNSQGEGTNLTTDGSGHIIFYRTSESGALVSEIDFDATTGPITKPSFDGIGYIELVTYTTGAWRFYVFDATGTKRQLPETTQPTYAAINLVADGYVWKFRVVLVSSPPALTKTWTCDDIGGRTASFEPPTPLWDWTALGTEHGRLWLANATAVKVYDSTGAEIATFALAGKFQDNGPGYTGLIFDRAGYLWDISLTARACEVWDHTGVTVGAFAI